jgi:primosomal protein N''
MRRIAAVKTDLGIEQLADHLLGAVEALLRLACTWNVSGSATVQ